MVANAYTFLLLENGRFPVADKNFHLTLFEVSSLSKAASADANLSGDFTAAMLQGAISKLKGRKSPGHATIHPELMTHQSAKTYASRGSGSQRSGVMLLS